MTQRGDTRHLFIPFARRSFTLRILAQATLVSGALFSSVWMLNVAAPNRIRAPAAVAASAAPNGFGALLVDLRSHAAPQSIAQSSPLEPKFAATPRASAVVSEQESAATSVVHEVRLGAPLPPRRPAEFGSSASRAAALRADAGDFAQQNGGTAAQENGSPLEKFFGERQSQPSRRALAYAGPETGVLDDARRILSGPTLGYDRWTAVYDISAHTVYLPDGTKLEAHSGLGEKKDNPRYVHVRMRGATPPHIYDLSLRERLFHGVQALRLTPIGGESQIFGRAGLLAHTYMLGPRGDSNGCVVFKNYTAFLRAFQNGEIKRLAVVGRLD